ncbi:hypothetical protein PI125_g12759 [Phytophthora idaei]|nr:hypothetical protein PI125_g12759 [Phytophthora idaei]KAG3149818.1 hypothetical protein PI126_g11834 [Phytophthora idaei]
MRFTFTLVIFVATFQWGCTSFTNAESANLLNNVSTASDTKHIDFVNKVHRLTKGHKLKDEERIAVPNYAAMMNVMRSKPTASTRSSQILRAVEGHKPLPKWTSALIVLLGLGMLSGSIALTLNVMMVIKRDTSGSV